MEETEFSSGIVVPLVKFSEHVGRGFTGHVERAIMWINAPPLEREKILAENDSDWALVLALDKNASSDEKMLDDLILIWAQGASDHFAHLDPKAPESLSALADLMFEWRHPNVDGAYRGETEWLKMLAMWSEAAMDIDEMLGVHADWGTW